jgi:hypothetical protein
LRMKSSNFSSWRLTMHTCLNASKRWHSASSMYDLLPRCDFPILLCQVGVERPIHICSRYCDSHFKPPFKSIVQDAHRALNGLFSPPESVLKHIREPLSYPTQDHIRLSRVIGLVQHNLYFSDTLSPEVKRIQVRSIVISVHGRRTVLIVL